MCLHINTIKTKTARENKTGKVVRWKVVTQNYLPSLSSLCYAFKWKPGFNESNRINLNLDEFERKYNAVGYGIHVCTTRKEARRWATMRGRRIIKVICYKKDLIAVGNNDEVYMKVFVPKDEYDSAINRKSKERK